MSLFNLKSNYAPTGDQPQAIDEISSSFLSGATHQTLLGVTGSGKTFTMANVISKVELPTLVIAPNKTLATQLFYELRDYFPDNAVEFFVSYYDYYQPEAYIVSSDTYIAKDSSINDDIDQMRHAATRALFERRDIIIVSSVSCIYGLGTPTNYAKLVVNIEQNEKVTRNSFLKSLLKIRYSRNDMKLSRGTFRVRGDTVDILPPHRFEEAIRVEFFDDSIDSITIINPTTGKRLKKVNSLSIYPNSHYITVEQDLSDIVSEIQQDLRNRLIQLRNLGKLIEAQRLEQRVEHDIELIEQLGYCPGIENYSRYLTHSRPGDPPSTLLDYFPKHFLTILDESHLTIPQLRGMYRGDQARKTSLVEYGFRLPAALDNRPLSYEEFTKKIDQILYVSATPNEYELKLSGSHVSEQIIRPTGLLDPKIEVVPARGQVDDLYYRIKETVAKNQRVLVTTLTKVMAEDLTSYYSKLDLRVRYLHAGVDTLERVELINGLRQGDFDVLIGINLLREGLDIPEVSLVAIMDADKEGFLRSRSALIQIVGRAARNSQSQVIMYADTITDSMRECIDETKRRRDIQDRYNQEHGIVPTTIKKKIGEDLRKIYGLTDSEFSSSKDEDQRQSLALSLIKENKVKTSADLDKLIHKKIKLMEKSASQLDFELAASLKEEVAVLKEFLLTYWQD